VWVDETRPRSQGASLTAWELSKHGVPNTLIVDNAGGHLMQSGKVDMCIVGSDRTASNGDVCNKIGTYMKALCAFDNNIPFYVALPESTIDFSLESGVNKINIEERDNKEITHVSGINSSGVLTTVKIVTDMVSSHNPGFDVTPARLVTRLITDKGVCEASPEGIKSLFR
jgi:methylthioribose-1-phosphate isomerase